MPRWTQAPRERFESKFAKSGGCWLWLANRDSKGYGNFYLNGRSIKAHRAAYLLYIGEIPKRLFVCHRCDTPSCVRPSHLFLGTAAENTADMIAKGRAPQVVPPILLGSQHPQSRLTEQQVMEIRLLLSKGETQTSIAILFGVSRRAIGSIKTGRNWGWMAA